MDVPKLYLIDSPTGAVQRLIAFEKVSIRPKESRTVTVTLDPRLIGRWSAGRWLVRNGTYKFALAASADALKIFSAVQITE
jgi:beta-glucosidase